MKIAITGGHFSPAYALITSGYIKDCVVLGRKTAFEKDSSNSLEYELCQKLAIPFEEVRAGRINRRMNYKSVLSTLKLPVGVIDSIRALNKHRPDVVLSFGGYIGFSVSVAAYLLKIPVVVHEQTQKAGVSNRLSAKFAKKICIAFKSSGVFFPKSKIVLTGNPLRDEIFTAKKVITGVEKPFIYITGGSTGANAINRLVFESIEKILSNYNVLHQAGNSKLTHDFEKAQDFKKRLAKNLKGKYVVKDFVMPESIGWALNNASLVVSRAGINTVMELIALEKMSLLIPLPYGQENEQLENAKLFKSLGLGEYLDQKSLTPDIFLEKIGKMLENCEKYKINKNEKQKIVLKDASKRLFNVLKSVYEKESKAKV